MQTSHQPAESFTFNAIGVLHSGFRQKFAVPRQAGLVASMEASIEIFAPYAREEAFRELSQFSHIWVIFVFHQSLGREWRATVRPPRFGGNTRVGVFASRSPFRPNPIGLSAVELLGVECAGDRCVLRVRGADLVDGTPVLDIKPYIPYADAIAANPGYSSRPAPVLEVRFSELARQQLAAAEQRLGQPLMQIVRELLALDPRPAYQEGQAQAADAGSGTGYGVKLFDFDLRFNVVNGVATVEELVSTSE